MGFLFFSAGIHGRDWGEGHTKGVQDALQSGLLPLAIRHLNRGIVPDTGVHSFSNSRFKS